MVKKKVTGMMDSSAGFKWSSKLKYWIELAGIAITFVLKSQEDNKDREEDDQDAEDKD